MLFTTACSNIEHMFFIKKQLEDKRVQCDNLKQIEVEALVKCGDYKLLTQQEYEVDFNDLKDIDDYCECQVVDELQDCSLFELQDHIITQERIKIAENSRKDFSNLVSTLTNSFNNTTLKSAILSLVNKFKTFGEEQTMEIADIKNVKKCQDQIKNLHANNMSMKAL